MAGDAVVAVLVDVGLAVGNDDDLVGREVVPQQRAQSFRAPLRDRLGLLAAGTVDFAQQPLQVPHQRLQAGAAAAGPVQVVEVIGVAANRTAVVVCGSGPATPFACRAVIACLARQLRHQPATEIPRLNE